MDEPLRAIDLCCGAGGWACAARGLPIEFLVVADLAADCLETWRVNHAQRHANCDRLEVDLSTKEGILAVLGSVESLGVDLVLGGIPCEQISLARSNNSKAVPEVQMDRWYALLDNCLELVRVLRPAWWAIEDVIAIERHLPLPLWFGQAIPHRRMDASEFGPQKRLRSFLGVFPEPRPVPGPRTLGEVLRAGPWRTIPKHEDYERSKRQYYSPGFIRVWEPDQPGYTVMDWGPRHARAAMIEAPDGNLRCLDWQEAAALQGFPEDYLFAASYTRTWKMIAQAIPIQVGRAILAAICQAVETKQTAAGSRQ